MGKKEDLILQHEDIFHNERLDEKAPFTIPAPYRPTRQNAGLILQDILIEDWPAFEGRLRRIQADHPEHPQPTISNIIFFLLNALAERGWEIRRKGDRN